MLNILAFGTPLSISPRSETSFLASSHSQYPSHQFNNTPRQRTRSNKTRAVITIPESVRDLFNTSGTRRFASPSTTVVQEAWERHRSRQRYARHILGFPTSKLGRRLLPFSLLPVAECVLLRIIDSFYHSIPHISSGPVALTSGIVGLLLAFRTNASLARYYEARGAWAAISTRCVDTARIALEYINGPATIGIGTRSEQLARYVAAFPHVVRSHLEAADDDTLQERCERLLTRDEIELVLAATNRPAAVLQLCTHAGGNSVHMDEHCRVKMDNCFTALLDSYNTVLEKLLRTPIPLSYTRHTSRACLLWCAYVPLPFYTDLGFLNAAISSAFITFLVLGIDDVGVQCEDPCRLLPLDEICAQVERDVLGLRSNTASIDSLVTRGRFVKETVSHPVASLLSRVSRIFTNDRE